MQNTRLNLLVDGLLNESGRWIQNPWRRTSLLIISLLFGNFLATALSTSAGQSADWDVLLSTILTVSIEVTSWFIYGSGRRSIKVEERQSSLLTQLLNALKIGLIYGLFLDAFKLGS
jgi:hypothetical protein